MLRVLTLGLLASSGLFTLSSPAHAQAGYTCPQLIADAEARRQIPHGLLMALAITESGLNGAPNPYAMNIAGRSYHARDTNEMAQVIASNWARGIRSIDVGCMQINLMYHGDKFSKLTDLLHSPTNVEYGASYLIQLATERGSWREGVMDYHNKKSPARRRWYGCKVWNNYLRISHASTGYIACGAPPGGSSVASNAGNKVNTSPLNIPGYSSSANGVAFAQNTFQTGRVSGARIGGIPLVNPSIKAAAAPIGAPRLQMASANVPAGSPLDSAPSAASDLGRGGPIEANYDIPQPRQRVRGSIDLAPAGVQMAEVTTSVDPRATAFKSVRPADWSGRIKAEEEAKEPPATSTGASGFAHAGPAAQ